MDEELGIQFEILPRDALGRYHFEGKLRIVKEAVFLHYKNRERTFTRKQNKLETIELELRDIEELTLDKKWWGWKGGTLKLKVKDPRKVEKMSAAQLGAITMTIPRKSIDPAEKFIALLDYKLSEDALDRQRERLNELGVE